jgi:hypothetical protein
MSELIKERVCAEVEADVVVFLIGMRINKLWKFWKWLPVVSAMPRMLKELAATPGTYVDITIFRPESHPLYNDSSSRKSSRVTPRTALPSNRSELTTSSFSREKRVSAMAF